MDVSSGRTVRRDPITLLLLLSSYVLAGLSVIFQVLGMVTPWWVVVDAVFFKFGAGLWYANVCLAGICQTESYETFRAEHGGEYVDGGIMSMVQKKTVEALLISGLATAALPSTASLGRGEFAGQWCLFGASLLFYSGSTATNLAITFIKHTEALKKENSIFSISPVQSPTSAFLTGFGGILAWIALIFVVMTAFWNWIQPSTHQEFNPGARDQSEDSMGERFQDFD